MEMGTAPYAGAFALDPEAGIRGAADLAGKVGGEVGFGRRPGKLRSPAPIGHGVSLPGDFRRRPARVGGVTGSSADSGETGAEDRRLTAWPPPARPAGAGASDRWGEKNEIDGSGAARDCAHGNTGCSRE